MTQPANTRSWLVRWMQAAAIAHLLVGAALPWIGGLPWLDGYHQRIEAAFWGGPAPAAARLQQQWWLALFGATLQNLALWMLALTHFGNRYRNPAIWGWMIAGLLLWAPQDMLVSLRAGIWGHVWIDLLALALMLPALLWLYRLDQLDQHVRSSPNLPEKSTP